MNATKTKELRSRLADLLGRSPTKSEFRAFKRCGGSIEQWITRRIRVVNQEQFELTVAETRRKFHENAI